MFKNSKFILILFKFESKKMEEKMVLDFFPDSTLKGSQFYFYCPNMNQKDKVSISKLIKDYEGVISYLNKIIFNLNYSQYHSL